ncbi:hypothetical protein HLB23_03955 [Nocardia uniformis]|uniref:Uncharacterized protein n=1 Tax=Nocardia uniformis TaxID=53432 RepID=A0A849BQZ7_9NOCA|nr:hypothetical protein [Nocardia uniformis]NNH69033.1 hypothetical protein [Nocardia uniformis]
MIVGGVVLDVPGVVGACRRHPYPEAVVWTALHTGDVIVIPAAVLAEARSGRVSTEGLDILEVLLGLPQTVVAELDADTAQRCGVILAAASTPQGADLAAAQAVVEATRRRWPVTTNRSTVLTALDATTIIDEMP